MTPAGVTTPSEAAGTHVSRYEELRSHAVNRLVLAGRHGLAVLVRDGLAAWVEQWSMLPAPALPRRGSVEAGPLPDDASAEIVHVLAAMALVHVRREMHA
ncbi:MAG: hypothetical protein QGG14_03620 [Planctomycetota bacterium]|jgi:hypothetical protein|nr:hypothetical protein [Planctomycetota bacterium]MDP6423803.1 hypothetical protein [Planctomycetota bacterium]